MLRLGCGALLQWWASIAEFVGDWDGGMHAVGGSCGAVMTLWSIRDSASGGKSKEFSRYSLGVVLGCGRDRSSCWRNYGIFGLKEAD